LDKCCNFFAIIEIVIINIVMKALGAFW